MRDKRTSTRHRFSSLEVSNGRKAASSIETAGEVFSDGSMIELVRSDSDLIQLLFWDGSKSTISSEIRKNGKVFIPPIRLDQELSRAIRLPKHPRPYGTTEQLSNNLHNWFAQHPGLPDDSITIVVCFVLRTLFPEYNEIPPTLSVVTPDPSSSALLLHLLECVCRHSLRVVEISEAGIFALPTALHPTILVDAGTPTKRLQRVLRVTSRPGGLLGRDGRYREISCPLVIVSEKPLDEPTLPNAIQVVLMPTRGTLPRIDRKSLNEARDELQGNLLQYRLTNHKKVLASNFKPQEFNSPLAETARSLGACVVDHPQLQSRIIELLKPQDEDWRIRRSTSIPEVVIEVGLALCHEANRSSIYVSELAEASNAILENRKEIIRLEPRAVGDVLRNIGVYSERLGSAGRGIRLLNDMRRKIHRLAYSYGVLSMRDGINRCEFCRELPETP